MASTIAFLNDLKKEVVTREHKGKSLIQSLDTYVVIDIETTGLDPRYDEIIEVAAIRVEAGEIVETFKQLIKPNQPIPTFITDLTGITNELLESAPCVSDVIPNFLSFVENEIVVGHNVNFDINFIYDNSDKPFTNDFVDTMRISRRMFPEHRHHRLSDLTKRYNISEKTKHRALADVVRTNGVYTYLKNYAEANNISFSSLIPKHNKKSSACARDIKTDQTEFDETTLIFGKHFVFTGKLERMIRKEAMQIVVDLGGCIGDNVSSKTNYLVLGDNDYCVSIKDGKSSKQKKAEELKIKGQNIEIISENLFYEMVLDNEK